MFFILSKVFTFLLSPFIWIILVFLFGFFTKYGFYKRRAFIIAFAMLLFFSNGFICDQVIKWWELEPVAVNELKPSYDYAIVLGGMASYDSTINRIIFHESTDRLLQALDLYSRGYIDTLIISGGSARLMFKERKEASVLKEYLVRLGLPSDRIIADPNSRNTQENAANTLNIIKQPDQQKILLVTSAFHMRRARAVFQKKGFNIDTYPAHFISSKGPFNPVSIILPTASAFLGWDLLIKEMVGLTIYKIKGYA